MSKVSRLRINMLELISCCVRQKPIVTDGRQKNKPHRETTSRR